MDYMIEIRKFKNNLKNLKNIISEIEKQILDDGRYGKEMIFKNNDSEALELRTGINDYFLIKLNKVESETKYTHYLFNVYKNIENVNLETGEDKLYKIIYDKYVYGNLTLFYNNGLYIKLDENNNSEYIIENLFEILYKPKEAKKIGF